MRACCTGVKYMYEIAALIAVIGTFVQLGMEVFRLRKQLNAAIEAVDTSRKEAKAERERLIGVLAAAQSDKIQHSLGFLPDSELQAKKRELDALKKSFQSSD